MKEKKNYFFRPNNTGTKLILPSHYVLKKALARRPFSLSPSPSNCLLPVRPRQRLSDTQTDCC